MAYMNTKQRINIEFTLKDDESFSMNAKEVEKVNEDLLELVYDCIEDGETDDFNDYEIFNDEGEEFEAGDCVDLSFWINIRVSGSYSYTPARMYLANGDPGYPAEVDWDPQEGWIEDFDKARFNREVRLIQPFGQHIEAVKVYIDDYDDDADIETDDEEPDWD